MARRSTPKAARQPYGCEQVFAIDGIRQGHHAVEQIVDRLTDPITTAYTFQVYVANHEMINAFAAPGGYVVVNAGLLRATSNPEELSGVLAHEIAHVTNQHGTRSALRQIPIRLILAAATGEIVGLAEQTVKNYVVKILDKTHTHNRAHAAALAAQRGWLSPLDEDGFGG